MKTEERWHSAMQANYGTPRITLVKGEGSWVWDEDGNKYLDFLAGIATNILGHSHPDIVEAVSSQISHMSHVSNLYIHKPGLELAEKLQDLTNDPQSRVFFCNSGAEANEAAIKLSKLSGRKRIISTLGGFHGRTSGALSITGQEGKRKIFEPLLPHVKFVPFGDLWAIRKAISRKVAMVIVEPIQGENGVVVPPEGYLRELRSLCNKYGVLLAFDCVQTGMGRTGEWFGYEHEGIKPDIITLAKGLGAGLPLGAMITLGDKAPKFKSGEHGSTFGGNPISCAAANSAIDFIVKKSILSKVNESSEFLKGELSGTSGISEIRGRGLLLGIVLEAPIAQEVAAKALDNGLLINAPAKNVIRIAPALNVGKKELRAFIAKFAEALDEVQNG